MYTRITKVALRRGNFVASHGSNNSSCPPDVPKGTLQLALELDGGV
jgi:hypothetical protein